MPHKCTAWCQDPVHVHLVWAPVAMQREEICRQLTADLAMAGIPDVTVTARPVAEAPAPPPDGTVLLATGKTRPASPAEHEIARRPWLLFLDCSRVPGWFGTQEVSHGMPV